MFTLICWSDKSDEVGMPATMRRMACYSGAISSEKMQSLTCLSVSRCLYGELERGGWWWEIFR
jgi:hypothetical protein